MVLFYFYKKFMKKQNENYIKAEIISFTIYNLNNEEDVKKLHEEYIKQLENNNLRAIET